MKKKVNVFGKSVPVLLLVLLGMGLVSAALLSVYGSITGSAVVTQSVVLTGAPHFAFDGTTNTAGQSFTDCGYSVKNHAEVEAPIILETTCDAEISGNDCIGVTTEVYGVLELTKKDTSTWQPIEGTEIEITYTIVGDTFEFSGVPEGYTLIYYMDEYYELGERLANPQPAIIVTSGIGSLPYSNDANVHEFANYCQEPDYYVHCKGAKLWVVLTSDINNGVLAWGNWDEFYFETDLIVYSDTSDGTITLPSKAGFDFCVDNDFALNLEADTYTIDVSIVPQTA